LLLMTFVALLICVVSVVACWFWFCCINKFFCTFYLLLMFFFNEMYLPISFWLEWITMQGGVVDGVNVVGVLLSHHHRVLSLLWLNHCLGLVKKTKIQTWTTIRRKEWRYIHHFHLIESLRFGALFLW
jgi:hypothetical protein